MLRKHWIKVDIETGPHSEAQACIHLGQDNSVNTYLEMSSWVPLLGMDEGWEEDGISDEEDGSVVAYEIPVTFLCVEFHSIASRIPVRQE